MGIFDRMGKVISSNVNSLLDKAEDDRKLLDLTVEEMGEQLKRGRNEVISAVANAKQLKKKHEDLVAEAAKWERRAELALKTGDEALAREALKQKKRVSGEAENAERQRQEQHNHALDMKAELERMEQKLEEIKMRKSTIATRAEQARSGTEGLGARGGSNAFENFRRMEEKIEGREAQNSAMAEVEEALGNTEKTRDLEARFRDLERGTGGGGGNSDGAGKSDIDDELAALKKRIRV
ncbi:PspA/IM30 family protein [Pendulispora brunnea]|uniref:PspA/IM30 family protein n=1 Tax=Pendulispora brunnea TaxID=2905690 RepID=A0ABZ2KMU7_9BACT